MAEKLSKQHLKEINEFENDKHDAKYRVYASISFAVLLLGIGVPLWWHTTAVPRVSLPYAAIAALTDMDVKIQAKVIIAASEMKRVENVARQIEETFRNAEIYKLVVERQTISSKILPLDHVPHELEAVAATFNVKAGEFLLLEARTLNTEVLVGSGRTLYFARETDISKIMQVLSQWILRENSLALTRNALTQPKKFNLDEENRRRFPASPAYDILLTLVNPNPEKLKVQWDLPAASEAYIQPLFNELSIVANFTIKSQRLYLLPLDVAPKRVPDSSPRGRHFALSEDVLSYLITPLEKKLASQVSLHPCINLVAYVVPCEEAPLHIYSRKGYRSKTTGNIEAFHSPRWGGVVFANPLPENCENVTAPEIPVNNPQDTVVMGIFLAQLRLLLGIPEMNPIARAQVVPVMDWKLRGWELDSLLRVRAIEQLTSAKLTLQSLAQLLEEISNIVITETVGNRIKNAVQLIHNSLELLNDGDLTNGFILSKEAFVTAEAAFTDPSLLALLYFPEDQKYAVYIPLFLPAMIPVLLSLKNIYRYYLGKETGSDHENKDNLADTNDNE